MSVHERLDHFMNDLVKKLKIQEESFKTLCEVDSSRSTEFAKEAIQTCTSVVESPLSLLKITLPVWNYYRHKRLKSKARAYINMKWLNDDFETVVVEAGVALFRSFEYQFSLLTDDSGYWRTAIEKLAANARDRFVEYCEQNSTVTITPAVFIRAIISEPTDWFSGLSGKKLIFQNKPCTAGELFEKTNCVLFENYKPVQYKYCKFQNGKDNHMFGYRLMFDFEADSPLIDYEKTEKRFYKQIYNLDAENANLHKARIVKNIKQGSLNASEKSNESNFEYYIKRVFTRCIYVSKDIINQTNFFITVKKDQITKKFIQTKKEILMITKNEPHDKFQRIHWLNDEDHSSEHFTWIASKHSLQNLRGFIDTNRVQELEDIKDTVVILAGEPGMGKTTFFMHMQTKLYSIRIALKDFSNYLKDSNNVNVLHFLCEANKIYDPLERQNLEERLQNTVVFLDGYSELDSICRQKIINYLKMLRSCFKLKQIWISTRPYFREELEDALVLIAYQMKGLSIEEQQKCIVRFWSRQVESPLNVNEKAKQLLELFYKSVNEKSRSFMTLPLHIRMVAEDFEQCDVLPASIDLLALYERCISKKYDIYTNEYMGIEKQGAYTKYMMQPMQERLEQCYKATAVKLLFQNDEVVKHLKNNSDTSVEEIVLSGLIGDFKNGVPIFVHRTFAEYYASKWLVENCQSAEIIMFLKENIFKEEFYVINQFFDAILIRRGAFLDNMVLHKLVLSNNINKIAAMLAFDTLIEHRDFCGRTALHIAMSHGNPDITHILLKNGADPNTTDHLFKWTPLVYGCRAEKWRAVNVILNYTSFNDVNIFDLESVLNPQNTSLMDVCINRNLVEVYKLLYIKYRDTQGDFYFRFDDHLSSAIKCGSFDIVKYLFESDLVETNAEYYVKSLNFAMQSNQIDIAQYFLEAIVNVFYETTFELPPIIEAVHQSNTDMLELLLDRTSHDIRHLNNFLWKGQTLLEFALEMDMSHKVNTSMIELLLQYDLQENINNPYDMENNILLLCASRSKWEMVKYLIEKHHFNVNTYNSNWVTPLYYAIKQNNLEIVKYLISQGAIVDYAASVLMLEEINCDWDMLSCLIMAQQKYKIEQEIKFLFWDIMHLNVYRLKLSNSSYSATAYMLQGHDAGVFKQKDKNLLRTLSQENFQLIFKCNGTVKCLEGRQDILLRYENHFTDVERCDILFIPKNVNEQMALKLGIRFVDVKGKFFLENNPVTMSVFTGNGIKTKDLHSGTSIRYLISDLKYEPNNVDCFQRTLFYRVAAEDDSQNLESLRYLLENNADVNKTDVVGNTALHRAIIQKKQLLVEFLLANGAKIGLKNNFGATPLHLAARVCGREGSSIFECLAKSHSDLLNETDILGLYPLEVSILHDRNCKCSLVSHFHGVINTVQKYLLNKDAIKRQFNSTLFLAVSMKKPSDIIRLLIEKGATAFQDKHNHTLLHEAIMQGETDTIEIVLREMKRTFRKQLFKYQSLSHISEPRSPITSVLQQFIVRTNNDFINKRNSSDKTPLMTAVLTGKYIHVDMLIQAGANIAWENSKQESAVYFAVQCARPDIVELLIDTGGLTENLKTRLVEMVNNLQKQRSSGNLTRIMEIVQSHEISELDVCNWEEIVVKAQYFTHAFLKAFQTEIAVDTFIQDDLGKDLYTATSYVMKKVKWKNGSMQQVLVDTALQLFKSYEHQFSTLTTIEGSWRVGLRFLAVDASRHVVSYVQGLRLKYVTSYELLEDIKLCNRKLYHESHYVKWKGALMKTSKLFYETGLAIRNPGDSSMNYYRQRQYEENRDCGFRQPFPREVNQIQEDIAYAKCRPLSKFRYDYQLTQQNWEDLQTKLMKEVDQEEAE